MKILVMDRDALSCQLLQARLDDLGHDVVCEPSKTAALELIAQQDYDLIMFDPSPVQDARAIIISIYKTLKGRSEPQFLILSKNMTLEQSLAAGANDIVQKPVSTQALKDKIENTQRLLGYCRNLSIEQNLSSIRGIINKEAFNELFLSAIDRAHRYAERSFVVFITVETDAQTFEAISGKLKFIRRQSDVIGRTGEYEFAILLQRPLYESEPLDACTRFAEVLSTQIRELTYQPRVEIDLCLVEIPLGECHIHSRVTENETVIISE